MGQPKLKKLGFEEYLAVEIEDNCRYEYDEGYIRAMAGGTTAHSIVCSNINIELGISTKGTDCRSFNSEQKVELRARGRYYYPDAHVACGEDKYSSQITGATKSPTVIVEVLSPGTIQLDTGSKWAAYRKLPTLREYVLIYQDEPFVHVFRRENHHQLFHSVTYEGMDASLELPSIGANIPFTEIYDDVEFSPKKNQD